MHGLFKQR
ncbi:hypothetical protein BN1708_001187 [Verticillium longisporum]|uniref:Uncharacterized protein n=1 Tax=Verticillium longisporum TaxID=100787 RepID=A0A0G4MHK8_VERLO|nr:hypothetical protein BN1708_001187 [Verticillium longisporum]